MRRYIILICIVLATAGCIPLGQPQDEPYLTQSQQEENIERDQPIIDALDQYYDDNHAIPRI